MGQLRNSGQMENRATPSMEFFYFLIFIFRFFKNIYHEFFFADLASCRQFKDDSRFIRQNFFDLDNSFLNKSITNVYELGWR